MLCDVVWGVWGILCIKIFAWQAKRDPASKVRELRTGSTRCACALARGAQVLGGEWAAILPKAELVWDLRLSLEMVSNLHPTILLHLVFCSEILIYSPPPFPTAQFNKSSFVSQCILETWEILPAEDRQEALPCRRLFALSSAGQSPWRSVPGTHAWGSGIFRGVTEVTVG